MKTSVDDLLMLMRALTLTDLKINVHACIHASKQNNRQSRRGRIEEPCNC